MHYRDEDEYHDERMQAAHERKLARRYCTECRGSGGHHVSGCPNQGEDDDDREDEEQEEESEEE